MDCIHQIIFQFPSLFEFNNNLLVFIGYHIHSGKYGSFLYNSELEIKEKKHQAKNLTVSIWTDIIQNHKYGSEINFDFSQYTFSQKKGKKISYFVNPFYNEEENYSIEEIYPDFSVYKLRLWEEYFLRYLIQPENGKFESEINISEKINEKKNLRKIEITNSNFYEIEKIKEKFISKEKDDEINYLKDALKDICDNVDFNVADYSNLASDSKRILELVSNCVPCEKDGKILIHKKM